MKIFIGLFFLIACFQTTAQPTTQPNDSAKILGQPTDSIYSKPEVQAKFKRGEWSDFLDRNMTYPSLAKQKEIQGTVTVQFVIEMDGSVTNVHAKYGPLELKEGAENLIRKSPKWKPALNNGKPVRTMKLQPIVYRLTR